MSVRIETIEQLQDSSLVEKVLDRLRRTTKPRNFAFKKRCKLLDGKPVLITAPPGRKVKSSLLRKLRLGTPTLKGIVHREKQELIFTFKKDVNKSDTARWISKCMHDAKSPVPLKHIIILGPNDSRELTIDASLPEPSSTPQYDVVDSSHHDVEHTFDIESAVHEEDDQEILSSNTLLEPASLDDLFIQHISSKKIQWLKDTEQNIEQFEVQIQDYIRQVDSQEGKLHQLQTSIDRLTDEIKNVQPIAPIAKENPWLSLIQVCKASPITLDALRNIFDVSLLPTQTLLKELQFLSDEQELFAFRNIETYSLEQADLWEISQLSTKEQSLHAQILTQTADHQELELELSQNQEQLDDLETKQFALLLKLSKR